MEHPTCESVDMVNAWEFLIGFYGIFDDFLGFAVAQFVAHHG